MNRRLLLGIAYGLQIVAATWGLWYVSHVWASVAKVEVIEITGFRRLITQGDDRPYVLGRLGQPTAQGHSLRRAGDGDIVVWTLDVYAPASGDPTWMVITYDENNRVVNVLREPAK